MDELTTSKNVLSDRDSVVISGGDWQLAGSLKFLDGYRFSAFWLRSSVVSVLISLISGM
jgi:hypothetical protein